MHELKISFQTVILVFFIGLFTIGGPLIELQSNKEKFCLIESEEESQKEKEEIKESRFHSKNYRFYFGSDSFLLHSLGAIPLTITRYYSLFIAAFYQDLPTIPFYILFCKLFIPSL
ncbi:MAG: hypothetical protein ACPGD5_01525 [Salibacteraceae bacterium]